MAADLRERTSPEDERADQLSWLREGWRLVAATVALCVVVALAYSLLAEKRYEAHARVLVTPLPADNTDFLGVNGLLRDSTQGDPAVTAAQVLGSDQVRHAVEATEAGAHATFDVTPRQQSNTVDIAATASSADAAAAAANAYLDTALQLRNQTLDAEASAAMSRIQSRLTTLAKSGL